MASEEGYIHEAIPRLTGRGWRDLGLGRFDLVLQGVGNPVAAMPSLHAGITFLVAMYGIWRLRTPLRYLLVLYPIAMSLTLVYYGEHYVVDVLAGARAGRDRHGRLRAVGAAPRAAAGGRRLHRVTRLDARMARGARPCRVLARERPVAVEVNPRAISQMPNVSSNNPPGMAPTSPAPATPNSSSRLPPAKNA